MTKATLTPGQTRAAVFAGIFGHLLFAVGWTGFGVILVISFFALIGRIVGGSLGPLLDGTGAEDAVDHFFSQANAVFVVLVIVVAVIGLVLLLVGFLISLGILRRGGVRRPAATTWSAFGISAVIDGVLFFVYLAIGKQLSDATGSGLLTPLVWLVGTVGVGVLVWYWMAWGHRGTVDETVTTVAPPVTPPATQPVLPPPPPGS